MQNRDLKVLFTVAFHKRVYIRVPAILSLDRDATSRKGMSCSACHARPVEDDQGGRIQPGILDLPAAQNCGAMEGEPPKVFTVSGQCEEVARDDKLPLHLPQRLTAQTSVSILFGEAKYSSPVTSERPPLLMGASYGPQPPSATPSRRKFAPGGTAFPRFASLLTQPKLLPSLSYSTLAA